MSNLLKALAVAGVLAGLFIGGFILLNSGDDNGDDKPKKGNGVVENVEENRKPLSMDTPQVEKITLSGSTVKEGGGALAGVKLSASSVTGAGVVSSNVVDSASSNAQGLFSLDLRPGKYRIRGRKAGYEERAVEFTIIEGQDPGKLVLEFASGLAISGYVRNTIGDSVAGARISAFKEYAKKNATMVERLKTLTDINDMRKIPAVTAVSDSEGWYQVVGLGRLDYRVGVVASGYAPGTLRHIPAGSTEANFSLQIGGLINGSVSGVGTGPIAGAEVSVYSQGSKTGQVDIVEEVIRRARPPLAQTVTDGSGVFTFDELGGNEYYRIFVQAAGYQPAEIPKVSVGEGEEQPVSVELAVGLVIAGIVLDPQAQPLPNARVKVNPLGGVPSPTTDLTDEGILTDENGEFIFDTLREGKYRILVSHQDYAGYQQTNLVPGQANDLTIQLTWGGAIEGYVTDSQTGGSIPGAIVRVRDLGGIEKTGTANSDGFYRVTGLTQFPNNSKTLVSVEAEGYARFNNGQIQVEEGYTLEGTNFELDKNGVVSGVVINGSGQTVEGVQVAVKRQHSPTVPVIVNVSGVVTTDADGKFIINDVAPGELSLVSGSHEDYLEGRTEPFDVGIGEEIPDLQVVMRIGGAVRGVVRDENGNPLEGVFVAVPDEALGNMRAKDMPNKAVTNENGEYRIDRLEEGTQMVRAEADGFLDMEITGVNIAEGKITEGINIDMMTGAFISGQVTNTAGEPLANAKVTVIDMSAGMQRTVRRTDANGYYRFDDLGPYEVRVDAEMPGYSTTSLHDVAVNNDAVDFQLLRMGSLQGMVYGLEGGSVPAFSVTPKMIEGGREISRGGSKTFNKGDGAFEFTGLKPGVYNVQFFAPGHAVETLEGIVINQDEVTYVQDVYLREGGKVSGSVVDANTGRPVMGAQVRVNGGGMNAFLGGAGNQKRSRNRSRGTAVTDKRGFFELTGLNVQVMTLTVEHRDYITQNVPDVQAGAAELKIMMDVGGTISGKITNPDGSAAVSVQLLLSGPNRFSDYAVSDRKGNYTKSGLPEGAYTVVVSQFGRSRDRSEIKGSQMYNVQVNPGRPTVLDIQLEE